MSALGDPPTAPTASGMLGLNLKAVLSLQEGSYLSAYSLFSSALERLRTEIDTDSRERPPATAEAALEAVPVRYAATADGVANNAFALYASAFVFAGSAAELAAASRNDVRLAAVVLYNFGLYFHVHGLDRPAVQRTHFAKALRMYQTALHLLEAAAAQRPAPEAEAAEDRDCLLRLALHNNVGHIYSCDYREIETQACLEQLRRILARMTDRAQRGDSSAAADAAAAALRGLACLDFHLNVVILHGTWNHPPAA